MTVLRVTLLGTFAVQRDNTPVTSFRGDKVRALLAYLAVEAGRPHARSSLAALLWPDQPQAAALNNLSQTLKRLRDALSPDPAGSPVLLLTRQTVEWNPANDIQIDVATFLRLANSETTDNLEAAAALYGGRFLPGFDLPDCQEFDEWVALTREHLERLALRVWDTLAQAHLAGRSYEAAEVAARRQLAIDPWREAAHRQLMEALVGVGQRTAALAQYVACAEILKSELGVEPDPQTTALYEDIRDGVLSAEPRGTQAGHRLPVPLTPFIGREEELVELQTLLRMPETRLLTLVGSGGMGKTRLALELARTQLHTFTDGVLFVPLVPLTDPSAIVPTLAATLALSAPISDCRRAVLETLRDKQVLLVMDNFEHLLDDADIVVDILQAAPQVTIVATSREPLNVRGEHVFLVQGLPYTHAGVEADVPSTPAVRFFVQSAQRIHLDFMPDATDLAAALRICHLVQGMPLGLELAAAWTATFPVGDIASEIERSADFLAAEWRDVPERQRSIRAVFDWSWCLLTDREQRVLRQLAVFRGGFSREAAQEVAGASLSLLMSLLRKSLVFRMQGTHGTVRYDIHELLRQFVDEHLEATPKEHEAAQIRHSTFYLALAEGASVEYTGPRQIEWLERMESEHDNIRAAQSWLAERGEVETEIQFAGAVAYFWFVRGFHIEWRERLLHLLSQPEGKAPTAARARALNAAGYFEWVAGNLDEARSLLSEAVQISREVRADATLAFGLSYLGGVANDQGDPVGGEALLEESLTIWRAQDSPNNLGLSLMFLGDSALRQGDRVRARAAFTESALLLRETQNLSLLPYPVRRLGDLARQDGDSDRAAAHYTESAVLNRDVGDRRGLAAALVGLAAVAGDCRQWVHMARLLGAAEGLLQSVHMLLLPSDGEQFAQCVSRVRAQLDSASLHSAWTDGNTLSLEQLMVWVQELEAVCP